MKGRPLHSWQVTVAEAYEIQRRLASQVSRRSEVDAPRLVAGVDISAPDRAGLAKGAVVVLSLPDLALVESTVVEQGVSFPYIPGLLSFRETPLLLAACERLPLTPDLFIADAQGIAHPRRLGLASHLGLLLDVPAIGCAKSILCGSHGSLGEEPGSYASLLDNGEVIGAALRTKRGVKPVYVSIGNKVDLEAAIHWVLACCRGYRLPEPTRLAHLAAAGQLPVLEKSEVEQGRLL
ncbi:MAG: deoxyribonuclease V [Dehalococcoidia bacterium]|nr:deoxyribonuclease V [Dehalococcoidia bacterium]